LGADERFRTNPQRVQNRAALLPLVEALLRSRPTAEWEETLRAAGVPHAPVWNYADLFSQPQVAARGMRLTVRDPQGRPVELVGSPFHIRERAGEAGRLADVEGPPAALPPGLGQHTEEALADWLGLDAGRLDELRRRGVI
jgi:crotonobetainyl-CoA:carnitine CoA-transferase CaiB-like acyl-CoA transferase